MSDPDLLFNDKIEVKILLHALFDLMNMHFSNNHKKLMYKFPLLVQNRKKLEVNRQEQKKKKPITMVKSMYAKPASVTSLKFKKFPSS